MKKTTFVSAALLWTAAFAQADATHQFKLTAVEVNGTKFWLPSTIVVHKGDVVKIRAVSKVPGKNSVHGLAIDEFKIQSVVDTKDQDIEFVASKAGIFPIRCHMHEAHIGSQLVVLD